MLDSYKVHIGDKNNLNGEDFNRLRKEVSREGSQAMYSENAWCRSDDDNLQ